MEAIWACETIPLATDRWGIETLARLPGRSDVYERLAYYTSEKYSWKVCIGVSRLRVISVRPRRPAAGKVPASSPGLRSGLIDSQDQEKQYQRRAEANAKADQHPPDKVFDYV